MGKRFNQNSTILFVGGRPENVPKEKVLCSWQHWPEDGPKLNSRLSDLRLPEGKNAPNLVICFSAHCSHGTYGALKELTRDTKIPLLSSKSVGLVSFIEGAKMHYGIDISKCFDMNSKKDDKNMKKTPTRELNISALLPRRMLWARELPKKAIKIDGPGMSYYVKPKKDQNWLTLRGDTLIEIAAKAPPGAGPTGCLTIGQAEDLKKVLIKKYGLNTAGVSVSAVSIKQHVDTIRGSNSPEAARKIMGELNDEERAIRSAKLVKYNQRRKAKKDKKKEQELRKKLNSLKTVLSPVAPEKAAAVEAPPVVAPVSEPRINRRVSEATPVTMDSFLRDMAYVMKSQADLVDRLDSLHRENTSLRSESAVYVEQIEKLEDQLKDVQAKLYERGEQLKKWKALAAAESS